MELPLWPPCSHMLFYTRESFLIGHSNHSENVSSPPYFSVKSWHQQWKLLNFQFSWKLFVISVKLDKFALTTHYEHLARLRSWVLLCLTWLANNLGMLNVLLCLPMKETGNSPTLLGFDTKQHIPESPAAPDVYTENRNKNNYNQAFPGCA